MGHWILQLKRKGIVANSHQPFNCAQAENGTRPTSVSCRSALSWRKNGRIATLAAGIWAFHASIGHLNAPAPLHVQRSQVCQHVWLGVGGRVRMQARVRACVRVCTYQCVCITFKCRCRKFTSIRIHAPRVYKGTGLCISCLQGARRACRVLTAAAAHIDASIQRSGHDGVCKQVRLKHPKYKSHNTAF